MRTGQNPNKAALIKPLEKVVVLVITHLPDYQDKYHQQRKTVIDRSIQSLFANSGDVEYSMMVWDNGSNNGFQDWLNILPVDILVLSRNIGKTNALKSVMRMLPPGTILAYGDDDIEFFPNWLAPQIEILETYPNVGTVTGWPVRIAAMWGEESTRKWAVKNAEVELSRYIPGGWEQDYCTGVGIDYFDYDMRTRMNGDLHITYKGVRALATSQHCQFVCYPERIEPLIQWTDRAMADEIPFDKAVDAAGLLRLSTVERYTRHIGNVLEKEHA